MAFDGKYLVKLFNNKYINAIKKSNGIKSCNVAFENDVAVQYTTVDFIVNPNYHKTVKNQQEKFIKLCKSNFKFSFVEKNHKK